MRILQKIDRAGNLHHAFIYDNIRISEKQKNRAEISDDCVCKFDGASLNACHLLCKHHIWPSGIDWSKLLFPSGNTWNSGINHNGAAAECFFISFVQDQKDKH